MSTTIAFSSRVSVPASVLLRDLDGEAVVLDLQTEQYYGLDDVGTRMWIVLTTSGSIQAAFDALLEEYEVEPERLRADLAQLLAELVAHGLLVVHD